jgi:hypothetical protein
MRVYWPVTQQWMSCCLERNFGNVFTEPLPSNGHVRYNILMHICASRGIKTRTKRTESCRNLGFHSGGYEEYYPTFRRNILTLIFRVEYTDQDTSVKADGRLTFNRLHCIGSQKTVYFERNRVSALLYELQESYLFSLGVWDRLAWYYDYKIYLLYRPRLMDE